MTVFVSNPQKRITRREIPPTISPKWMNTVQVYGSSTKVLDEVETKDTSVRNWTVYFIWIYLFNLLFTVD